MAHHFEERTIGATEKSRSGSFSRVDSETVLDQAVKQLEEMKDGGLQDPWEAISLFGHAFLISYQFDLVGLTDDSAISKLSVTVSDSSLCSAAQC